VKPITISKVTLFSPIAEVATVSMGRDDGLALGGVRDAVEHHVPAIQGFTFEVALRNQVSTPWDFDLVVNVAGSPRIDAGLHSTKQVPAVRRGLKLTIALEIGFAIRNRASRMDVRAAIVGLPDLHYSAADGIPSLSSTRPEIHMISPTLGVMESSIRRRSLS
jgi:hypothetical protein